ncbi:hypothetical protein C1752_04486 [Acaryochloris thomasi RCC1774]|uniref:SGNH hydrolase-type esterase domain-containing protein n=1 Tax=Acaryochloris thomasi RCC1774 TaxID=1764569 RepID=A0A2W1JJW6_9CYAN|nr:SGNH/GDSL hydrolase family protein [Acaryochloris thomasi]PZD71775.1 hypothetical protein C1752_04486 [Acaryochloris thomasi RCC1774]
MNNSHKISPQELRRRLINPKIKEKDLQEFLIIDPSSTNSFEPIIRVNPSTVNTTEMSNGGVLNGINRIAKERRQLQYRLTVNNPLFRGQKIVSEGDSWFQFPILLFDVIDQLFSPFDISPDYAIFSLGEAGDLLSNIINEDEITQAIEVENPEVFLISGSGNDLVFDGNLANFIHPFEDGRPPENYLNNEFYRFKDMIRQLYRGLYIRLLSRFPDLKIIGHGYDYVIPDNGVSLGRPMKKKGIEDPELQKAIMRVIIDHLNESQLELVNNVEMGGRAFHVDCRGEVGDNNWFDELHPNNAGFARVSYLFTEKIKEATGRS